MRFPSPLFSAPAVLGHSLSGTFVVPSRASRPTHGSSSRGRPPQATEACLDLVAAEAAKKGLALAYLMDDQVLSRPLLGDPVRIRQVGVGD